MTAGERCAVFVVMLNSGSVEEFSACYNMLIGKTTGKIQKLAWEEMTGQKVRKQKLTDKEKKEKQRLYYKEWERRNMAKRRESQRAFARKKRMEKENNLE